MNFNERKLLKRNIDSRLERLQIILDPDKEQDAINDDSMNEALINIARHEKARLLANANWIETSEAGLCQSCGTEIPIQRLLTVPTTRFCIDCAARVRPIQVKKNAWTVRNHKCEMNVTKQGRASNKSLHCRADCTQSGHKKCALYHFMVKGVLTNLV